MSKKELYLFEEEERPKEEIMKMVSFLSWTAICKHMNHGRRTVKEVINFDTNGARKHKNLSHPWRGTPGTKKHSY